MLKKVIANFHAPTPNKWRKIGYGLLSFSTALGGYIANYTELPNKNIIIGVVIVSGVIGKFITDLATQAPDEK